MWNWIKEAIAPARCAGCFKYGGWLCGACSQGIRVVVNQSCYKCGNEDIRGVCDKCKGDLDGLVVAFEFDDGWMRKAIHQLKYGGNYEIVNVLIKLVIDNLVVRNIKVATITWVPMHYRKKYVRGYNQAKIIAEELASALGVQRFRLLSKITNTHSQVGLDRQHRLASVQGSIEGVVQIAGEDILIVDDVVTTGATLDECAKVLKNMGAGKVYGFVIARRLENG